MNRRVDTVQISGGAVYAKVAARSAAFHGDNTQCSVETSCEFKEGYALFTARVTSKKGVFTGHSMGKTSGLKAFEKLETIAVGRALAFAGYLADGEIACAEEMEDLAPRNGDEHEKGEMAKAIAKMQACVTSDAIDALLERCQVAESDGEPMFDAENIAELRFCAERRRKQVQQQ